MCSDVMVDLLAHLGTQTVVYLKLVPRVMSLLHVTLITGIGRSRRSPLITGARMIAARGWRTGSRAMLWPARARMSLERRPRVAHFQP